MEAYVDTLCLLTHQKKDNNKFKNNQNFQEIKLYGSSTTKELKKKFIQTVRRGRDRWL